MNEKIQTGSSGPMPCSAAVGPQLPVDAQRSADAVDKAIRKLFQLRAAVQSERCRVMRTADVVTWNALEIFSDHAAEIHAMLLQSLIDQTTQPVIHDGD